MEQERRPPIRIVPDDNLWIEVTDGDPRATALYSRHCSVAVAG